MVGEGGEGDDPDPMDDELSSAASLIPAPSTSILWSAEDCMVPGTAILAKVN